MPTQESIILIRGTIGNITFYKCHGKYYCRRKSSLNKERFKKDPAFAAARQQSSIFARAMKLAAHIYSLFPQKIKKMTAWRKLSRLVIRLTTKGTNIIEIITQSLAAFNLIKSTFVYSPKRPATNAPSFTQPQPAPAKKHTSTGLPTPKIATTKNNHKPLPSIRPAHTIPGSLVQQLRAKVPYRHLPKHNYISFIPQINHSFFSVTYVPPAIQKTKKYLPHILSPLTQFKKPP